MDRSTDSSDAPDRAASVEPVPTRPNPFDEGDLLSRKRRRTSRSISRSQSVDSATSDRHMPTPSTIDHQSDAPAIAASDSAMSFEDEANSVAPQTPEKAQKLETDSPPTSSRVTTINLRVKGAPDRPSSRISSSSCGESPVPGRFNTTIDRSSPEHSEGANRALSSSDLGGDEEAAAKPQGETEESEVTIVGENVVPFDPLTCFPFREPSEHPEAAVGRLLNFFQGSVSGDYNALKSLTTWVESTVIFFENLDTDAAAQYTRTCPNLWRVLPDLTLNLALRRSHYPRSSQLRQAVNAFFAGFAKLTAALVGVDNERLQSLRNTSAVAHEAGPSYLLSGPSLACLPQLARRDQVRSHGGHGLDDEYVAFDEASAPIRAFQRASSGKLSSLLRLAQNLSALLPGFPHIVDASAPVAAAAASLIREALLMMRSSNPSLVSEGRARLAIGYQFFEVLSQSFSTAIDKHITHLSGDSAQTLMSNLGDILKASLGAEHIQAVERLNTHRQRHPAVASSFTTDAIMCEWRFGVLAKLIMSSQMQLRVMAVTTLGNDLVSLWKRFTDDQDGNVMLTHLASCLLQTGLIDYILGPTCHPEIAGESGNVVSFLAVTEAYQNAQTDLLWRTMSNTEDPRISEGLLRMASILLTLIGKEQLLYLCRKFESLPVVEFSPAFRTLCDQTLRVLSGKYQQDRDVPDFQLHRLCIRLLRESTSSECQPQSVQSDVHSMAIARFRDLLSLGLLDEQRRALYVDCTKDISSKSPTTLGSLYCLLSAIRLNQAAELRVLTAEYDLTRLLVEELEHAAEASVSSCASTILNGARNAPRRDLVYITLVYEPKTMTVELGLRLADVLVGHRAVSQDDRDAGWQILNSVGEKEGFDNPFLSGFFSTYMSHLPVDCLRVGTLHLLQQVLQREVSDVGVVLDNDESLAHEGIEQLWRMILATENENLADSMIRTLVHDVYIESNAILGFPHSRARRVHLRLVNRCLEQMDASAKQLKYPAEEEDAQGEHAMDTSADHELLRSSQERIFVRSLVVLRIFLNAYQNQAQFSAPDIRSLMPEFPDAARGDSAGLRYQSFDGDRQTDVLPLNVGRDNSAASLLASLKQATGFDNYRVYYRGAAFAPDEDGITKSLEELRIYGGLLLVKREDAGIPPATKIKPGASAVEIEILGHFKQLWEYLGFEGGFGSLADQVYALLIKLPADSEMLDQIDLASTTCEDLFPKGRPFQSLYVAYAIYQYFESARRSLAASSIALEGGSGGGKRFKALHRSQALLAEALNDPDIVDICEDIPVRTFLCASLIDFYLQSLQDTAARSSATVHNVVFPSVGRLVEIMGLVSIMTPPERAAALAKDTIETMLTAASLDQEFCLSFQDHPQTQALIETFLLTERNQMIRANFGQAILDTINNAKRVVFPPPSLRSYFWRTLSPLILKAANFPFQCHEFYVVTLSIVERLLDENPELVDIHKLVIDSCEALRCHETTEQLGSLLLEDTVALNLSRLVRCCLVYNEDNVKDCHFPDNLAADLFWQLLFPRERQLKSDPVPRCILTPATRSMLCEILLVLAREREDFHHSLLRCLDAVVSVTDDDADEHYSYDLPQMFDRTQVVRSACGYSGLRNLGNTCYLNSLLTQLFMNVKFRHFLIQAPLEDENTQELLLETQKLFASMQETTQRFSDPTLMVGSIKTYDDTMIDVSIQMDVDEFFNLLFDRWEGQLLSSEERKIFRGFYGGQLVQQVSSKECEHVSERLEPFSAIQCDIKGKRSLLDSLQAYVDGEVMQGDNKYKCSTCDRHVDAVKRACLKDIPDNVIFHLKRFDFNLRTLQRHKINDYFSFPRKIDMHPYTIGHLSKPEASAGEEDTFELVGVLVHAGTAESGHYYSYLRERPSSGDEERWVEFNDETVTYWNPANMEEATFGASDLRPVFDANGMTYEKSNNAYMLFYQRSSSLRAEEEDLRQRALLPPVKVDLPGEMSEYFKNDNTNFLRRHCLFDPSHLMFVLNMFRNTTTAVDNRCPPDHKMSDLAMQMMIGHFDQAVARAKDYPLFEMYREGLEVAIGKCPQCALAFYAYLEASRVPFRQLVQRHADAGVRARVGDLFLFALEQLRKHDPARYGIEAMSQEDLEGTIAFGVIRMFRALWASFHTNTRAWPEVFGLVLKFARLGNFEIAVLLHDDWLVDLLQVIAADASFPYLTPQLQKLLAMFARRGRTRLPSYSTLVQLVDHLMGTLQPRVADGSVSSPDERLAIYLERRNVPMPWTAAEVEAFLWEEQGIGSLFVRKLLDLNQELGSTEAILHRLAQGDPEMQSSLFRVIESTLLSNVETYSFTQYLRAVLVFLQHIRQKSVYASLLRYVSHACIQVDHREGRHFLEFFQAALQCSSELPVGTFLVYFDFVPVWGPSLLGYHDSAVAHETLRFINGALSPKSYDEPEMRDAVVRTARELAIRCLVHLQSEFLAGEEPITPTSVGALRAMIYACEQAFYEDVEGGRDLNDYKRARKETFETLQGRLIEEVEDDASDWNNSVASSEQLDNLADVNMQVADEFPDAGMQ